MNSQFYDGIDLLDKEHQIISKHYWKKHNHRQSYINVEKKNVDVTLKMETVRKVDNNIVLYRGKNVDMLNSTSSEVVNDDGVNFILFFHSV